jgi:spermidine synthase
MLGHIPALLHPDPKTVLIVGCGAGVTAGSFIVHPNIERIVVCEIEPLIPVAATKYFGPQNYNLLDDERVEVVDDDARHYIATTSSRFDIITSDPIHPWVKGAATLYSKEYFELCKSKLNPAGVIAQWVPLYETTPDAVQTEIATFFEAFSQGTIWSNEANGQGYDLVVVGQLGEETIDVDAIQTRLDQENHRRVTESLREIGFPTAVDLLRTYAGRTSDLGPWVAGAQINHDRNLRLQYMAGLGLNRDEADRIYRSLVAFRRFPTDLIPVGGPLGKQLKATFE